jgi:hypothetical protein
VQQRGAFVGDKNLSAAFMFILMVDASGQSEISVNLNPNTRRPVPEYVINLFWSSNYNVT